MVGIQLTKVCCEKTLQLDTVQTTWYLVESDRNYILTSGQNRKRNRNLEVLLKKKRERS